jgi:hypothetical protein
MHTTFINTTNKENKQSDIITELGDEIFSDLDANEHIDNNKQHSYVEEEYFYE